MFVLEFAGCNIWRPQRDLPWQSFGSETGWAARADLPRMGQQESVPGFPLDCLLKNFSDFQQRARGYGGPPPDPEFLRTLSQLEWPTFDVGWPTEGTFDLSTLFAVRAKVYRVPHPDQFLYIEVWVDIATERPGYIRKCLKGNQRGRRAICLTTGENKGKGRGCSSAIAAPRPPRAQPRLYPVLPGLPEDPLDPVNAPPPNPRREELNSSLQGTGGFVSPSHTRGGTLYGEGISPPAPDAPLRAPPRLIYVPFSTSDLYNWKHQNPPFSEKPQGLIFLLQTIFRTHQPTWDDCQQILRTLFTSEERDRIMREASKAILGDEGETMAGRREMEDILPALAPEEQMTPSSPWEKLTAEDMSAAASESQSPHRTLFVRPHPPIKDLAREREGKMVC